ncbi:hypothetical protein DB29_03038 [Shouchella clausii]|nr:hypothetical protein DB29_03038 [Shouchella clausii]
MASPFTFAGRSFLSRQTTDLMSLLHYSLKSLGNGVKNIGKLSNDVHFVLVMNHPA